MSRSQHSPALERLVQLLIDGADDAVLDHILLDAIESLEVADAVAIWRVDEVGELRTCLASGAEESLPDRAQLREHLSGAHRLGSEYHIVHASVGGLNEETGIALVLFDRELGGEVDAADTLLELCARSTRIKDSATEHPPAALPAVQLDAVERELAHDLRNHLAGLRTVCDLLQVLEAELEEDERDRYGAVLKRECRRAGELLASALETEAQAEVRRAPTSELVLALKDVVASEEAAYRISNAELQVRIETAGVSENYSLGAFDFSRVIRNLLVNVREACASPAGPATHVLVELQPDKTGRGGLVLSVEDDGPGVALGIRGHLFEEGVSTKLHCNAGSGLAAVRSLVESVRGEVRVQHLPMRGTRFQIWIPELPIT